MLKLALRGLLARRWRALLSALAVTVGVAMIAGTFVFTDTIDAALHRVFSDAGRGADLVVSGRLSSGDRYSAASSIPRALVDRLRQVPGVQAAEGQIFESAALVGRNRKVVDVGGSPTLAISYMRAPFQSAQISAGRVPRGPRQVAIDEDTASAQHLRVGAVVRVATLRPVKRFRVVGLVRFGGVSLGGATFLVFGLPTAQRLFFKAGRVDSLAIKAASGTRPAQLATRIAALLPPELQVHTTAAGVRDTAARFSRQLNFLTEALLALAFIAVFVGAFVIFNTHSITVAQRGREFALLRALGARRGQIVGTVMAEALVAGLLASAAGIAVGFATALAIRRLFVAVGIELPNTGSVLEARTVAVCLLVGCLVTLAASLAPALRATRVAPMVTLHGDVEVARSGLARLVRWLGAAAVLGGPILMLTGLQGPGSLGRAAAGAIVLVLGLAVFSPALVPAAARAVGWPLRLGSPSTGRLAQENAGRNPSRTAATAAALTVGLAVVAFVMIFANGARQSIRQLIARSFTGDLAVVHQDGVSPIPVGSARVVARVPGVQAVSVFKSSESLVSGAGSQSANGIDPQTVESVYRFQWVSGTDLSLGLMGPQGALVEQRLADIAGLRVGSSFHVKTPSGLSSTLFVRGIYRDSALLNGYALGLPAFNDLFHQKRARRILVKLAPGADPRRAQQQINAALKGFPETRARSEHQLADDQQRRVDQVVYLLYGLLVLSVVVSLFGIVNALTLSTYERTRELGVLRALGMSRRQLRRSVRYESLITGAIGSVLGLALGLFFARVVTAALSDQGVDFAVPWRQLGALLAVALVLSVLAAVSPAHRAARLDVLRAIAYE